MEKLSLKTKEVVATTRTHISSSSNISEAEGSVAAVVVNVSISKWDKRSPKKEK